MATQSSNLVSSPTVNDMGATLKELQRQKPPLECPFCGKVYRSFSGISYHVIKYHSHSHLPSARSPSVASKKLVDEEVQLSSKKRPLTYAEAQKMVEFDLDGSVIRSIITDPLLLEVELLPSESGDDSQHCPSPVKSPKPSTPKKLCKSRPKLTMVRKKAATIARHLAKAEEQKRAMPNPVCFELPEEDRLEKQVPERRSYFRFIDKLSEELDEELEYGMDEEDYIWLEQVNEERQAEGLSVVQPEVFELLIDRLEKESHFETRTLNGDPYNMIDEDAVCSICCDGECSNSNVILFCDMCNLAVHQECYGVPYIPEGQWLCRRCLQSPSKPVDCVLCPMRSGAFKQTDDNRWAHVVCALWIPEVCFANTVFLEPIDSIANIPMARWKLLCYICKKRTGACIQCFKTNCYTAFHVTCAQQAGLFMRIESGRAEGGQPSVKKTAYCDVHTPKHASAGLSTPTSEYCSDDDSDSGSLHSKSSTSKGKNAYQTPSAKLKEMQKKLLEKQTTRVPVVHIPFVPAHRMTKIVAQVAIAKKSAFIQQVQAYWMLKRQSRNGVPLLRRLQASTGNGLNRNQREEQSFEELSQSKELKEQLRCWQQLRHDLERVRLLIELIRKREKMKREQCKLQQKVISMRLKPLQFVLQRALVQLVEKDVTKVFAQPVTPEEAPDYHEFITSPMDFSTMQEKLDNYEYTNIDQFEADFNLMIQNCLDFNTEDTVYYRAALKMRKECRVVLKATRKKIKQAGIDPITGLHMDRPPLPPSADAVDDVDISVVLANPFLSIDDKIEDLEQKLDESNMIHSALARLEKQRLLRHEISKLRRQRRSLDLPQLSSESSDVNKDVFDDSDSPKAGMITTSKKRRVRDRKSLDAIGDPVKHEESDDAFVNGVEDQAANVSNAVEEDEAGEEKEFAIFFDAERHLQKPDGPEKDPSMLETHAGRSASSSQERVLIPYSSILPKSIAAVDLSTGRSRRSNILFNKKKRHVPAKPSPLAMFPGYAGDELGAEIPGSPLIKLRLRIDNKEFVPLDREDPEVSESGAYGEVENSDPNIQQEDNNDVSGSTLLERHKQQLLNSSLNFLRKTVNLKDDHRDRLQEFHACRSSELARSVERGEYVVQRSKSEGRSGGESLKTVISRKRAYSSSAASDGESTTAVKRKVGLQKRGRRSHPKLSFSDELRKIRGSDDIQCGVYMISSDDVGLKDPKLEPATIDMLQLIWAKCRGYPSYPALTINPRMPRAGYMENGVPIPIPPKDVLRMNDDESNYLILFFDARRTWQWLPRHNIEPLGVDSRLDEAKLIESRKPSMRKNVQEAYKRAIAFRRRIDMGESSDPDELAGNEPAMDTESSVDGTGST